MMQKSLPIMALAATAMAGGATCPANSPLSCHNDGPVSDTCCFIPAGHLVQTQFWDSNPATGPSDSWTIHGLWPDNCDGSFPSQCDPDRAYTNIGDILTANGASSTLDYMNQYWQDYQGNDESFWEHEWGKHGTCISTLEPSCYGDSYQEGQEAADFFTRTVGLFKTLPTYKWLAQAGITPSNTKTYDVNKIQSILSQQHGAPVTLNCKGKVWNEVWYHFNVQGSLQSGKFVAAEPVGSKSTCKGQVQYKIKNE